MSRRESTRPPLSDLATRLEVDIDPGILERAVTHRSFAYENGGLPTNERLEFLGDSVPASAGASASAPLPSLRSGSGPSRAPLCGAPVGPGRSGLRRTAATGAGILALVCPLIRVAAHPGGGR